MKGQSTELSIQRSNEIFQINIYHLSYLNPFKNLETIDMRKKKKCAPCPLNNLNAAIIHPKALFESFKFCPSDPPLDTFST